MAYYWNKTGKAFNGLTLIAPRYQETASSIIIINDNATDLDFIASGFTSTTIHIEANGTALLSKGSSTVGEFTLNGYFANPNALYEDSSSSSSITFTHTAIYGVDNVGASSYSLTRIDNNSSLANDSEELKDFFVANEDVEDSLGNHFVKLKKFYVKITTNGDKTLKYQVSKTKYEGYFTCPYFRDKDGNEIDYAYYGKYKGQVVSSKLVSKSGVTPTYSTTIDNYRTYARANGSDNYHTTDWATVFMAQIMFMIVYASTKFDSVFSYRSYGATTGAGTSFYGIEDMIGNGWEWVDGMTWNYAKKVFYKDYVGEYSGVITSGNSFDCSSITFSSGVYQTKHFNDTTKPISSIFPSEASGGSGTSYYCDYFYYETSSSAGNYVCRWGADGASGNYGLFCLRCDCAWAVTIGNVGSRLHTKELV